MKTQRINLLAALAALCVGCGARDDRTMSAADAKTSNQTVSQSVDPGNVPDLARQQMKASGADAVSPGAAAAESAVKAGGQKIPDAGHHF